jgi:adenosine deaminase
MGVAAAERTLDVALRFAGAGVVALNAAGSEQTGIEPFDDFFIRARAAGLGIVPHAGEWAGPDNIRSTIEHYRPDRIGHGVRASEDLSLVAELARAGLPLEICPLSNVATGVYPDLGSHPFPALRDAGVVVTLNSDDPTLFGGWLTDVYTSAQEAWGLTDADLADLARTAVRVSFADEPTKHVLTRAIDDWLVAAPQEPAVP